MGSRLTIEIDETGLPRVSVDGQVVGLLQHFSFRVDASVGAPQTRARAVYVAYEEAGDQTRSLLSRFPWLEVDSVPLEEALPPTKSDPAKPFTAFRDGSGDWPVDADATPRTGVPCIRKLEET